MGSSVDRLIEAWPMMRKLGWKDYQQVIVDSLIAEIERLKAELTDAKAASVLPVEVIGLSDTDWDDGVVVNCKSHAEASQLCDWISKRSNERINNADHL